MLESEFKNLEKEYGREMAEFYRAADERLMQQKENAKTAEWNREYFDKTVNDEKSKNTEEIHKIMRKTFSVLQTTGNRNAVEADFTALTIKIYDEIVNGFGKKSSEEFDEIMRKYNDSQRNDEFYARKREYAEFYKKG